MEQEIIASIYIGLPFALLFVGWIVGRTAERTHYRSLAVREEALRMMLISDLKSFPGDVGDGSPPHLVLGEVVIASDYMKNFLARWKKLIGGEIRSYLTLVERARREAKLRMMEQAAAMGFNAICNMRLETSDIGALTKGRVAVGVVASGTGYRMDMVPEIYAI